jgi:hypothetical protein
LRAHLRAFFLQSVLKDRDADKHDPTTRRQLALLSKLARKGQWVHTRERAVVQRELLALQAGVRALQMLLGKQPLSARGTLRELLEEHRSEIEAR